MVSNVNHKYKQSAIVTQVRDLQKNIRTRFAVFSNYSNVTTSNSTKLKTLINDNVIPQSLVFGTKLRHVYGDSVVLSGTQNDYTIEFKNVKDLGCINLLTISWTVNETSDLISLTANSKLYNWTGQGGASKMPITTLDATSICNKGDNNNIKWVFQ